MIHKARDLSPDEKTLIERLLGRSVSEDETISIRAVDSSSPPHWLRASWDSAARSSLDQLSMEQIDAEIRATREERTNNG